jgi:hypothetical protein
VGGWGAAPAVHSPYDDWTDARREGKGRKTGSGGIAALAPGKERDGDGRLDGFERLRGSGVGRLTSRSRFSI